MQKQLNNLFTYLLDYPGHSLKIRMRQNQDTSERNCHIVTLGLEGKPILSRRNQRRSGRVACTFRGWKNIWAINILWLRNDSIFKNYEWHFSLSSFFSPCYFSPRRGCPRVVKFCTGSKLTKILGFQPKKNPRNPPPQLGQSCAKLRGY